MKDLTVVLPDRPGSLAMMCEALGNAGINIVGICDVPSEIHICVEDAATTRRVLTEAGVEVCDERDVLIWDFGSANVVGKPGALGKITRKIADEGINIDFAYITEQNRLILAVNDLDKARVALE
jgi:hypothetical protein